MKSIWKCFARCRFFYGSSVCSLQVKKFSVLVYLGCGAHVKMLHRLDVGNFKSEQMMTLQALEEKIPENSDEITQKNIQKELDELLLPPWAAVADLAAIHLDQNATDLILHGQSVAQTDAADGTLLRLFTQDEPARFLGVAEVVEQRLKPKRLINTESD